MCAYPKTRRLINFLARNGDWNPPGPLPLGLGRFLVRGRDTGGHVEPQHPAQPQIFLRRVMHPAHLASPAHVRDELQQLRQHANNGPRFRPTRPGRAVATVATTPIAPSGRERAWAPAAAPNGRRRCDARPALTPGFAHRPGHRPHRFRDGDGRVAVRGSPGDPVGDGHRHHTGPPAGRDIVIGVLRPALSDFQ